jgi:hypothetical protein
MLKHTSSTFRGNLHHVGSAEIGPFPKAEELREDSRQKTKESAVLADIPVKTALD